MSASIQLHFRGLSRLLEIVPETLEDLKKALRGMFPFTLPQQYLVHYYDLHNNKQPLTNENDYFNLLATKDFIKQIKVEIEEMNSSSDTTPPQNNAIQNIMNAISESVSSPVPSRKQATDLSQDSQPPQNKGGDMLLEENLSEPPSAAFKAVEADIIKQFNLPPKATEPETKKQLKDEMKSIVDQELLKEIPYLAALVTTYMRDQKRNEEREDEENDEDEGEERYDDPFYTHKKDHHRRNHHHNNHHHNHHQAQEYQKPYLPNRHKHPRSGVVHKNTRCSLCGVFPIVGVRYRSTVIDDFDMCEDCEGDVDHPYPTIKIRHEIVEPPANEAPKEGKKPVRDHGDLNMKKAEDTDKKDTKLQMTSLFSNLSINEMGGLAAQLMKGKVGEVKTEMSGLLEKFTKFKLKTAASLLNDGNANENVNEENDDNISHGETEPVVDDFADLNTLNDNKPVNKMDEEHVKDDITLVMEKVVKLEDLFPNMGFEYLHNLVSKNKEKNDEELTMMILTAST